MSTIKQVSSKAVYKNNWMTVREDQIEYPDGTEGIYGVVEKNDFVVIVPVQDELIYIVEQYRYPVAGRYWELPQGAWDQSKDSSPESMARRELQEETGLKAKRLEFVGHQFLASGFSTQGYHIYFATDFEVRSTNLDREEQDLVSATVKIHEFESMILSGIIKDATSVNAYNLAKMKGFLHI